MSDQICYHVCFHKRLFYYGKNNVLFDIKPHKLVGSVWEEVVV